MERRKGIPLVALVIFIALLVAIILTCVIILESNKKNKPKERNEQISENPEPTQQVVEEKIEDELINESVINSDTDVQKAYKLLGNNKAFAKYAIYSSYGFDVDKNNLSNELKLQLAMAQVTNADMDTQSSKKAVSKDVIEGYITEIFGDSSDIEYEDFSLYNSDNNFAEQYKTIGYEYKKDTGNYEVIENDVTEEEPSEIPELITKVVKYNTKIEIYVKPIFIQTIYDVDEDRYLRSLFTDYNFQAKQFTSINNIMMITNDDYKNVLKSNYQPDIDKLNYKEVNQNIDLNQLSDYKYTLIKTEDGYNLKSFEKITSIRTNTSSSGEQKKLTEQEKALFNSQFDVFDGNGKSGNDVKTLLDIVISSNTQYSDQKDLLVSINFNNKEVSFVDAERLNKEIKNIKNQVNATGSYNIKSTYKSGTINLITINEE